MIKKFRSSLFKGLRVWAAPINNNSSGANSVVVCVLKLRWLKQAIAIVTGNAKNTVNSLR
ncbi:MULTISPECIES: hypothetical protein [unclassified Ruminococcus]|uniref:hypothetical protein n=1 Tax=unclassified Ruminococcus TaxID=2608920 RepID=UPI0018987BD2|nr:hypothetical protein [Ruminococcus sp. BSD2780120874_150323_B10]